MLWVKALSSGVLSKDGGLLVLFVSQEIQAIVTFAELAAWLGDVSEVTFETFSFCRRLSSPAHFSYDVGLLVIFVPQNV